MNRQPSPEQQAERREDEGRMWLFVVAVALGTMVLAASAIALYLNTAPWMQGFWETVGL